MCIYTNTEGKKSKAYTYPATKTTALWPFFRTRLPRDPWPPTSSVTGPSQAWTLLRGSGLCLTVLLTIVTLLNAALTTTLRPPSGSPLVYL